YILEGKASVWVGGQVLHLGPGDAAFLPRGVPHTSRIKSSVAQALNYVTPAGFEEWFRTLGKPAQSLAMPETMGPPPEQADLRRMEELASELGVRIIGPSPEF